MKRTAFFAACLALLPSAFAQEAPPAHPAELAVLEHLQKAPKANQNLPVSVKDKTDKKTREHLEKLKISLELKGAEAEGALLSLFKQIDVDYTFDPNFYPFGGDELDLPERAISVKLTNSSVARALDALTNALGVGWWAERDGDRVAVHIVKLRDTVGKMEMLANLGVNVKDIVAPSIALAAEAMRAADIASMASVFSDKKVSASAASPKPVAELIAELCKQGEVVFAIDSDVPIKSVALVFANVPMRTALEVLCSTAGLSMSTSRKGERTVVQFSVPTKKED